MHRASSVNLRLHLGLSSATWTLVHSTDRDGRRYDRRLDMGVLRYSTESTLPRDVVPLLQRAVWDLARKHGASPAGGGPGAPGGGGGRPMRLVPPLVDTGPLPAPGQDLDRPLPGL